MISLLPVIYCMIQSEISQAICLISKNCHQPELQMRRNNFYISFLLFTLPSPWYLSQYLSQYFSCMANGYPIQLINIKCKHFFTYVNCSWVDFTRSLLINRNYKKHLFMLFHWWNEYGRCIRTLYNTYVRVYMISLYFIVT